MVFLLEHCFEKRLPANANPSVCPNLKRLVVVRTTAKFGGSVLLSENDCQPNSLDAESMLFFQPQQSGQDRDPGAVM